MKYIDAEKLKAEIERRIAAYQKNFDKADNKIAKLSTDGRIASLKGILPFIASLQQEQPMPDSTKLIELWHEDKEKLKEKDFRNDPWRLAYNAFLCGFGRGIAVNKQEQPEMDLEKEIDRVFFQKDCGSDRLYHKEIAKIARHFYELGLNARKEHITDCEDLEEAAERYAAPFNNTTYGVEYSFKGFKAGAEWGEKNAYKAIMKKADEVRDKRFDTDYEIKIEPAAGFDFGCVNVYHEGKLVGQYVEPKEEKKLPEGVEEAAEKYDEAESWRWEAPKYPRKEAFKAGAKWQKEQMMKGAVEGYVTYGSKGAYVVSDWLGTYDVEVFGPNCSKVKVIIVKEEEQ